MLAREEIMATTITGLTAQDIRFPTSRTLAGSDAMNPNPDYSAAYCILTTDRDDGLAGHGLTFTIGRGNDLCVAAIEQLAPLVVGRSLEGLTADMAGFWADITGDSQLRWLGPEKGVIHLATAAVVNAVWDLWAKAEAKPLWRLLADLPPEALVACLPLRYLSDSLTEAEALTILQRQQPGRAVREARLLAEGYPAYTTAAGWLGYSDEQIVGLAQTALTEGFRHFKMKVGRDDADNRRRAALIRQAIGPDCTFMVDANQVWEVDEAIARMQQLAEFRPYWIEEPTAPDDLLGHAAIARAIAPIRVATGEHCANRILFKQFLQAGGMGICQPDIARLGGVNEMLVVLLLAAKHAVPMCPHGGGVGLCEYVQHLSMFDYLAVSGTMDGRMIEYVDHLHEHFFDPVIIRQGNYQAPMLPGCSVTMRPDSLAEHRYPDGSAWRV
jgi:L-fuconate dehydratase